MATFDNPTDPVCNDRGEYKLFVSGLPWACDDDMLWTKFAEHGEVSFSRVCYDQDSGRSRGFGFVSFKDEAAARKAKEGMDGADMEGRAVKCNYATDRPPAADRPKGVCYAFQKGECSRGEACRFSHDGEGSAPAGGASSWERPKSVCFAFQKGSCTRGDSCKFSHEAEGEAKTEEAPKAEEDSKKRKFDDEDEKEDSGSDDSSDDEDAKKEVKKEVKKADSDSDDSSDDDDSSSDDSSDDEDAKAAAAAKKAAEEAAAKAAAEAEAKAAKKAAKAAKKAAKEAAKASPVKAEKKEKKAKSDKKKKAKKAKKE